uniref:Sigma factor n=1 Tax=Geranium maderense TaxID=28964 RepID=A0A0G2SY84_9ROSI|nr:sigma factor [Geranium maderense]
MAMATVCSSSPNCSPTLPTISLPSLTTLHHHQQSLPSTTSKPGLHLVSNDVLAIASVAETVALANAALEAAMVEGAPGEIINGIDGVAARRKRRRKRRKGWEEMEHMEVPLIMDPVSSSYLTSKQEAQLCMCLKEGARVEAERRRIAEALEHEPSLEQLAMAMGMKRRSIHNIVCNTRESQKRLIRSYQGLIFSIANNYQGKGLSLQDLVQQGSIGLLRGAEKFDPNRGCKLSTYVYWWIRQAMTRAIENKRPNRLPGKVRNLLAKIVEANNTLSSRLRRMPSHDEVAAFLDVPVFTVKLIWEETRPPTSLNRVIMTERGHVKLQDIISDPNQMTSEQMFKTQLIKEELEKLLDTLSKRESRILRLRYGLDGYTPKSCDEIGGMLNLSRERIRQICIEALTKLQQTSIVDDMKMLYIV